MGVADAARPASRSSWRWERAEASSSSLTAVVDVVCDPSLLPWTRDRPPAETRHSLLRAYGANAFKSLARSHPLVFERHHPDLCVLEDGTVAARDV